jgi:hypothetical protein
MLISLGQKFGSRLGETMTALRTKYGIPRIPSIVSPELCPTENMVIDPTACSEVRSPTVQDRLSA